MPKKMNFKKAVRVDVGVAMDRGFVDACLLSALTTDKPSRSLQEAMAIILSDD